MLSNIYVINLDKDTTRYQNISDNFQKYNINITRVPGVYGKTMTHEEIKASTSFMCRTFLCNKSIIGSGLSHYSVWKTISSQPDGFYMVCEDDINLVDTSISDIQSILESINGKEKHPLFINLNGCQSYHHHESNKLSLIPTEWPLGISCYILTPETAKRLVAYVNKKKINQYIDAQISFCNCGILFFVTPYPVVKDSAFGGYKTSNNMGITYCLPLFQFMVDVLLPSSWSSLINFRLNLVVICIFLTYCLAVGHILLLFLFILNAFLFKSNIIGSYIWIELILIFLFYVSKK